jgi:hypothetical protein
VADLDIDGGETSATSSLESSVGATECVYLSVRELLAKVQSKQECLRHMVVPDSTSTTIAAKGGR